MTRMNDKGAASHHDSFAEHYLKHVALGEGCNCAESVLRTIRRPPDEVSNGGTVIQLLLRWLRRQSR